MATTGGVTQAVFPEGGLSLTGAMGKPRLGILSYIIEDFDPDRSDVVFVPVALNYDRVLEDRFLIKADETGVRRFRPPLMSVVSGVLGYFWARLLRKMTTFGTATVSFGQPLSLRDYAKTHSGDTKDVGAELMNRIAGAVPLLPVPLVARALLAGADSEASVAAHIQTTLDQVPSTVRKPRRSADNMCKDGLEILRRRGIVGPKGSLHVPEEQRPVLTYYSNSITHHFDADAAKS